MATENKVHATADDDADDEDLEALRLAALQTLRANKPPIAVGTNKVQLHHRAMGSTGARGLYRGGISRARPGRNNVFQRHRVNSNLIAIVPVSEDSTVGNSVTENKTAGRSAYSDSPTKLILPQDRYCKTGSSQITNEEHAVTSKFTRYEDYNSNSSAEESDEGEGTSIAKNVVATIEEPENDPDVLVMGAEDEEDSLEKLMDELEEEINRSETDVPVNNSKKKSLHKNVANKVNLSSENTEKLEKGAVKLSKNKHVSTISEKSKSKVPVKTKLSTSKNKVLHSVSPFHHKSVNTSENASYHKQSSKLCKEPTLVRESPSRHVSKDISPKRHFSPVNSKCSRSGTRSPLLLKRSRSRSPRTRYYSPPSRLPPSPRGRFSRSPIRSPKRSRSRSPARSYISSKEKCSRSPPWYPPANHHLARLSPRRSLSPHSRRDFSPRRSLSPRSNNTSSIRSPGQSRWPPSPRRSPLHPHRSVSPAFSRRPHSKSKRISPSPPRRPVSSQRRRLSPSPIRRNPSPPHKYSPLRRNPSPPRSCYSRSLSRSPLVRSRSPPISRPLHPVSPPPVSPRRRLSGSPRQHTSHSPYNRLPPKRLSPAARKSSPWSPLRQASSRYSSPPAPKQRSSSPFSRQRQRSNSADREVHRNRPPKRISHSPTRDARKPLQESRMTNTSARSRSPPAVARIIPNPRSRHGTRSPRHSVSPPRSMSRSSSLSLSPSPERTAVNDSHRYKSPLRVTDYRSVPVSAPKESKNALHHGPREVKGTNLRNHLSPLPTTAKVCTKTKSSKRKEFRAKLPKRSNKEEIKTDSINLSQDKSHSASTEKYTTDAACAKQNSEVNPEVLSVLEARRRKFETVEPVKPTAKKICLKAVRSEQREENDQQQPARVKEETLKSSDSESRLLEGSEDDFCDLDDHEPFPELDFLSSDESDIDQESRFKSSDQNTVTGDGMMGTMQFSKILDQPSTHEDKMVQHKKMLDGAKAKDLREKEIVDKTHTKQGKNSEDPWGKDKVGILAEGNKQSKAAGGDEQVNLEEVHDNVEAIKSSKDGDLRTELSRRRAERLTKAGSLHEKLPARLVQSAFEGVMGKKNTKHVEREEKHLSSKQAESKKEKSDVRRVLVLKRPVVERRVASISVTIPKESKRDCSPPPAKLPIRMRLGLPSIGTGSPPEERLSSRRRNRKMKLKRNVMLGNNKHVSERLDAVSNIIIFPISEHPTVGNITQETANSCTPLFLRQCSYCKAFSASVADEDHTEKLKWRQYERYKSTSSSEESNGDEGSGGTSAAENEKMAVTEDQKDSFDELIHQLEEAMYKANIEENLL